MLPILSSLSRLDRASLATRPRKPRDSTAQTASHSIKSNRATRRRVVPRREISDLAQAAPASARLMRVCAIRVEKDREIRGGLDASCSISEKRSRVRRLTKRTVVSVAFGRQVGDNPEKFIRLILAILRGSAD